MAQPQTNTVVCVPMAAKSGALCALGSPPESGAVARRFKWLRCQSVGDGRAGSRIGETVRDVIGQGFLQVGVAGQLGQMGAEPAG